MPFLRQSTAQTIRFGPCLDKTDGVTEETALTLAQADMRLSKDGGAFAQKSAAGNATHDSDGWYSTALSTTDTATVGELILNVHQPANMLPVWMRFWVLEEAIYDAMFGASAAGFDANQRVDVGSVLGTAQTAGDLAALLNTIDDFLDTEIAAIIAAVITNAAGVDIAADIIAVKAETATIVTDTNEIQGKLPTNKFMGSSDGADDDGNIAAILVDTADSQPLIEKMAYVGSRGLGVWIDDGAANTNTVLGTDGTPDNPVSTIAAATTIATALGSQRFYLINDTVITLAQIYEGYEFVGIGEMSANSINFGSQDVDNSIFHNLLLTGAQGGTGRCQAEDCVLSVITGMEITALRCLLANAGSLTLRDDCAFDSCFSAVAGAATPTLDINSVASVNVYFRHYSGGIQINNAVATTVMSYEADGQLIIDATCTSLTVVVRGNCSVTDNGTTTSLTQDAAINAANINAEIVDVLETDTHAEPSAVVAATASIKDAIMWLKALSRNKGTQTSTTKTLRNDADGANIGTSAVSDDGTTFIRNKWS